MTNNGLSVPECIADATEQYCQDMDPLRDFFDDCYQFIPSANTPVAHVRRMAQLKNVF